MKEKIRLIYGIGNEGKKFFLTKHNLGKEIIKYYFSSPQKLNYSLFEKYNNLILSTNLGYINEAGKGLKELILKFKIKPESVLVIHDDADLIFPLFKVSFSTSSAGHKGVESIIQHLKTKNFWRFRIGIQNKNRLPAEKIVLKKWSTTERKILRKIQEKFQDVFNLLEQRLPNELNIKKNYFNQ